MSREAELFNTFKQHHMVHIDLFSKINESDSYSSVNPMKQVPSLELKSEGTNCRILLTQSLPIIEFLDSLAEMIVEQETDVLGSSKDADYLIPKKDLILAYKTRQLAEIVNSGIQPYQNIKLLRMIPKEVRGEDNKQWIGEWQRKGLTQIEQIIKEQYGKVEANNQQPIYSIKYYGKLSMSDLFLVPSVEAAIERSNVNVPLEFPNTFNLYNSLKSTEIFNNTRK